MLNLKTWQKSTDELENIGISLPLYDIGQFKNNGKQAPVWIHFGGGNLYRGFHAEIAQKLANLNELSAGVVVCEIFDEEIITKAYHAYQNGILEVVMHENGRLDKHILASTAQSFYCHPQNQQSFAQITAYFKNPALQLTTVTITEKGYALKDSRSNFFKAIQEDIENGPEKAQHTMSIITSLLHQRFLAGSLPIAMVCTDNFSQNGQRFQNSIVTIAKAWLQKGWVKEQFISYLTDSNKVSFPWSMIDRITPRPSASVQDELEKLGFTDLNIIRTAKQTNIAPFVNTEAVHYLVLEDSFPNGRPAFEKAGVILTNRETVDKADVMKVTTCLNPLHTALAVTGCLLGYKAISAEMQDEDLVGLIKAIGYVEGLPVVANPRIIDPKVFIDEVIQKRLPNANIPDTPQRIATDTSQKVAIRFGETIKRYVQSPDKSVESLHFIPVAIAAWLRYLLAVDDQNQAFTPSPDPLLEELQQQLSSIKLGEQDSAIIHQAVAPILSNPTIFGMDLYRAKLGEKIEQIFTEMLAGPHAVRDTIHRHLTQFGENKSWK